MRFRLRFKKSLRLRLRCCGALSSKPDFQGEWIGGLHLLRDSLGVASAGHEILNSTESNPDSYGEPRARFLQRTLSKNKDHIGGFKKALLHSLRSLKPLNLCKTNSPHTIGRIEKTPTPKTRFSIWTLLRTPPPALLQDPSLCILPRKCP